MRIRTRRQQGHSTRPLPKRRSQRDAPLAPTEQTMVAIRQAEQAAAARLAAEKADQAEVDGARRKAAELLAQASRRASELAAQRREEIRAAVAADAEREHAAAAADIGRLQRAAQDYHDLAVQRAVTLVLTGEAAQCWSR